MINVLVLGSGQLGSRHLQALASVQEPLNITVVDNNTDAIAKAKQLYEQVSESSPHRISYSSDLTTIPSEVTLAIVATNAGSRAEATKALLAHADVQYLILEKLLFVNESDYEECLDLISRRSTKAWVNCCMRMMPFYGELPKILGKEPIQYKVSGSAYGLVTNAIHYLDHTVYLTGCNDFTVTTDFLLPEIGPSKREGYVELNGNLIAAFADGSFLEVQCYAKGSLPVVIDISNTSSRIIAREVERRVWLSQAKNDWHWQERDLEIPYQSQMTTTLAEQLLSEGDCALVPLVDSVKTHVQLLSALRSFLDKMGFNRSSDFPFT